MLIDLHGWEKENHDMLRIVGLKKKYGQDPVLKGIDLEFAPGEFVGIVGPSGSGKSVFLRCLAMKEKWDEGKLYYGDDELVQSSWFARWKRLKDWTLLDQTPRLIPNKTAYRNVIRGRFRDFPLWRLLIGGKASEDEHVRALDYLEQVGLLDKAFEKVEKLSGGEKQRVALAKSLCQGAKIVLADDPVSNLDPHAADAVLRDLRKLCERDNLIVVCVFRSVEAAERYSHRLIGFSDGRVALDVKGRRLTSAERMKVQ